MLWGAKNRSRMSSGSSWKLSPRKPGRTVTGLRCTFAVDPAGALTQRGILVENTQEATLKKLAAPECRLLLKYTAVKKRLEAIKGITRSSFCDGRVRAAGWNQLSARTGRITSSEPNLQPVPRDWRTGFRVEPPKLWLKGDLSQIEMVLIAIVTGDRNLIELLRTAGSRPHSTPQIR
jgi:DNA polymerase I-like protein with 3'-5' exonuclease and polymerase domains